MAEETRPKGFGQEPVASPLARWLMLGWGLIMLGGAFVAGRELWARSAAHEPSRWIENLLRNAPTYQFNEWVLVAGVVAAVLGLIGLVATVKPRARRYQRVASASSVWMRPIDLARMISHNARRLPGVSDAHTKVKRNAATVTVEGNTADAQLPERVSQALARLAPVTEPPLTFTVKVKPAQEVE